MNKKIKRRAIVVFVFVCGMYALVTFNIQERIGIKRVSERLDSASSAMNLMAPGDPSLRHQAPPTPPLTGTSTVVMPGNPVEAVTKKESGSPGVPPIVGALPLLCFAVNEGLIEQKGAFDAVRGGDEESLRSIGRSIGRKALLGALQREGFQVDENRGAEEILLGRGWSAQGERLMALYRHCEAERFDWLFPFSQGDTKIIKTTRGFRILEEKVSASDNREQRQAEWVMPDVVSLPLRAAVEKISPHSGRIRIYGCGVVTDQFPRASEKVRGEVECVLHGRSAAQ